MSSVRTDKEASTTLDDALKPKNRANDGDAVVLALKQPTEEASPAHETTIDGFHLVIDALKLNDIDTIFGLPGIPITDLTRMAQAEGLRVISFRHEQHAGNAAAAAGFLTQKPGICLTVSAPGFLNGLTALANATTNCFPMILVSGSSEREIVDLQQGLALVAVDHDQVRLEFNHLPRRHALEHHVMRELDANNVFFGMAIYG